ncbi:hypothetical protein [Thalassobacillus sp. CUG 92003]|uniref:hypothetical protein n=1 Tax=Thalassobacillus sp. CUG 92003 TaxID=2736641 RepID=UPI0015E6AED2|nr:hypothetical protein [Thalassobacillus sp. CUG 92003]
MNQLASYHIHLNQSFTTNEVMSIHNMIQHFNIDMYLHQEDLIADAKNLPKLLSFFLYADVSKPLLLIMDGENAEQGYQQLTERWSAFIEASSQRAAYSQSLMRTNNTVFV